MQTNSSELTKKFTLAYELSREGQAKTAYQIWEQLSKIQIEDSADFKKEDFIAQVNLYKAWTLMDLNAFREAVVVLESMFRKDSTENFTKDVQFDYYFSFANSAGEIAEKEKMESAFVEAMKVAKEQSNTAKIRKCWLNLLFYAELNGWWKYLEQAARTCIVFAESSNDVKLGLSAGLRRARALVSLGKTKRAEIQAKRIIQVALQFKENDALEQAQEFLNSLEEPELPPDRIQ